MYRKQTPLSAGSSFPVAQNEGDHDDQQFGTIRLNKSLGDQRLPKVGTGANKKNVLQCFPKTQIPLRSVWSVWSVVAAAAPVTGLQVDWTLETRWFQKVIKVKLFFVFRLLNLSVFKLNFVSPAGGILVCNVITWA